MADLKRFITQQNLLQGQTVTIEGAQYNHMVNAVRLKADEKVILLNGDGYDYISQITVISKNSIQLRITDKEYNERRTRLNLHMFCALLKGDSSEYQVLKLSELGVTEFTPFISENCVVKQNSGKIERLVRVAEESSKQCKRAIPMKVNKAIGFSEAINAAKNYDVKIIAYEAENKNTLYSALKKIKQCDNAALFIGPEGGFTDEEVLKALNAGFTSVTLGKTILKADTAAIAASSAVLYEAGEWSR